LVSLVVVVCIAEQKAVVGFVNYQTQISSNPNRPKVLVFGLVNSMKLKPRTSVVLLQIKRGDLDGLLFVGGQPCQAVCEGVRDAELHM